MSLFIDFHVHTAIEDQGMWTPQVWKLLREHYPDKCEDIERYGRDPRRFREYLESQGVHACVLLAEDSNQTGLVPNDYILEFSQEYPDFFIPFMALNPNKTGAFRNDRDRFRRNVSFCCEQLEWLAERGFKGMKDYGSYNLIPFGSELMFPLYEKATELALPVLFHTGESMFDSEESRAFANPEGLAILAGRFPDLAIVIGHCGSGKYARTAFAIARDYPNVFLEFSGIPPHLLEKLFFDQGLDLNLIPEKLIFGSDYPALPNGPEGIRKNIEAYRRLAANKVLSDRALEGLLGANARRLLHLDG
jgi:predicted TIM-barrel fold metal-dependent hydrolase